MIKDLGLKNRKKNLQNNFINHYSLIINRESKGFTLIELLVAIVIIGLLSGLLVANFVGVRQRARDGVRKSDLNQIRSALELYRADVGFYPDVGNSAGQFPQTSCGGSFRHPTSSVEYMNKIPCDPLWTGTQYNGGRYYYEKTAGSSYKLGACIENGADQNASDSSPGGTGSCPTTGGTSKYYVLRNP